MITGLGGGLALFLYGMRKMTEALKTVAGTGLKDVLARLTTNRFTGALSGAAITAVIQSSSVTTVMVVGFVSAGLITFTQSIGVIMGANIGTTVTAQIVAFHIGEYSLVMIAAGFLTELLAKSQRVRHYGIALMGLGLLFFGMELMSTATAPLRSYAPFVGFLQEMRTPYLGILAGIVFTAIVQSSSATTGIVIVLATQGFITLESGIALILGANVGTCITAGLSAIGRPREAVKAAAIHVLFNLAGVLLLVGFIAPFAELVRAVSPASPELSGAARLAADVPRQIANAHTIFNIASTLVLIGFAGALGSLVERIVPGPKAAPPGEGQPVFLDPLYLGQPALALDRVKLELERMAGMTRAMAERALPTALSGRDAELNALRERDADVDSLHGAIVSYLGQLSLRELVEPLPVRVQEYFAVANYLENAGDTVETGFVSLGYRRMEAGVELGAETASRLEELAKLATGLFVQATTAFEERDLDTAEHVLDSDAEFDRVAAQARNRIVGLMAEDSARGLVRYRLAIEHVDGLKRIQTLARRIAGALLDAHRADDRVPDAPQTQRS